MKIEIEFNSSTEASITIDGRNMTYGYVPAEGSWQFIDGITGPECDNTIGGIVAVKLTDPLVSILQAWLPDEESPDNDPWETWETLSESAAEEVSDSISF